MKALVTGAGGFLGSRLSARLVREGAQVRMLVRDRAHGHRLPDGEIMEGDVRDAEAMRRAVAGMDVVFHLATVFRVQCLPESVHRDVHVTGTRHLLDASLASGIARFVHCSTVGVYGHVRHPPATETTPFGPTDAYQRTKLEGELLAMEYHRERGLPVTVLRPTGIYGPGDDRLKKLYRMATSNPTFVLGSGEIHFQIIHVDDFVDALLLAARKPEAVGEAFIAGGGECFTLNELLKLIARVAGKEAHLVHLPLKPFQWAGSLVEAVCAPLNVHAPLSRRRVDFFNHSRDFDCAKARRLLGFEPRISLEEGWRETIASYGGKHGQNA